MKIIIISTNAGDGHDAAANALAAAAPPHAEVLVWHLEDFLKPWQTFLLVVSYRILVTNFKGIIWRGLYNFAQTSRGYHWFRWLVYICPGSAHKICAAVIEQKPEVVLTTHFYTPIFLEKISNPTFKLVEVVTDYGWHRLWFHPNINKYFVPSEAVLNGLKEHTNSISNIQITGIPVKPIFFESISKTELRTKVGVSTDKPMILMMTGGTGLVPADEYLQTLIPHANNWSLVIIAGKNKNLKTKLEKIKLMHNLNNVTILGWTNQVADYIRAADVVVTKPGGLTTSECMAAGRPMVLVSPIPGQEENNAEYFMNLGMTKFAKTPAEIIPAVQYFLTESPEKFANKKLPAVTQIWQSLVK